MVDPEREDAAAGAPADPESPASGEEWARREPREGDAILGATLDALKRAAQGVEIERQVAETLQRSLLPRLPVVPGLRLAARYRPGSAETSIGGDWYDAIALRGSRSETWLVAASRLLPGWHICKAPCAPMRSRL